MSSSSSTRAVPLPTDPTFDLFKRYITPTPYSPCLPEHESNYSKTPDCNLLMKQRGLMMASAVSYRVMTQLMSDPSIVDMVPPASLNGIAQFGPMIREMAKHDNPFEVFNDGTWGSWFARKIGWLQLWWHYNDTLKATLSYTKAQWDAIYSVSTEDEKAVMFCLKAEARRPARVVQESGDGHSSSSIPEAETPSMSAVELPD
jgi:hypothetical protein